MSTPVASISVPTRGRRHPVSVRTAARRLAAAGWNAAAVQRMLAEQGHDVHLSTICRWTDPTQAERMAAHQDRWNAVVASRRSARLGPAGARPEFKFQRMRVLAAAGLSPNAIAKVMGVDFDDDITEHQVRYALSSTGQYPRQAPRRKETAA